MSSKDRGPLNRFEIAWKSGHVETIDAHQVSYQGGGLFTEAGPERMQFHGEFDGRWMLVLSALTDDLRTVRNVTLTEPDVAS